MFFLCLPVLSNSQSVSIADYLSAPYCSNLVRSDDGSHIAWLANTKGIRSVYVASAPSFVAKSVYKGTADDGQVIGNIQFDHRNQHLFFVKGSGSNRLGEIANPSSAVVYPQRLLMRVKLDDNSLDTIGTYSNYVIGNDDLYIIVAQGSSLVRMDLADLSTAQLVEMRGTFDDVSISPDNESISFASNRGDHSFVGVYRPDQPSIHWVNPSVFRDNNPVWNPDGSKLAFIRSPGTSKGELANITGGNAFSIMIYDIVNGSTKELWSSPADDGGFAQYYHTHPLRWSADGSLLFYSEHEGFMKIYQLDPKTGALNNTMHGDCEVEFSDIHENILAFSSNCGDTDRRNVFAYDVSTKESRPVTTGLEIESDPVVLDPETFAYRQADHRYTMQIVLQEGSTRKVIFPTEKSVPPPHVVPEQVIFRAADGLEIHGQLFVKDKQGQKPALLFMHGGPIRQMLLGYHYSSYYANAYAFNQYMASEGYAVLSVNYRAGIGYGRGFRRAANQGPRGASEYQDIVAAARFLQRQNYIDTQRIGLWGGSYGGLLTAQGLAQNSDIFKAGVDFHGVHDWSWRATDFSEGGFWGISPDLMESAYQSSPVAHIDGWTSPVLMVHGDDDRNVMFGQTVDLYNKLTEKGVTCEVLVLPDEVHGFYRYHSWLKSFQASANFLGRQLK